MVEDRGKVMASGAGLLIFGVRPNRFLPQAGISAVAYSGVEKDYDAKARATLRGPLAPLYPAAASDFDLPYPGLPRTFSEHGGAVEAGVIEGALDFVRRHIDVQARIDDSGRRAERWDFPLEGVREAVVNAVAHRDYTIAVCRGLALRHPGSGPAGSPVGRRPVRGPVSRAPLRSGPVVPGR